MGKLRSDHDKDAKAIAMYPNGSTNVHEAAAISTRQASRSNKIRPRFGVYFETWP